MRALIVLLLASCELEAELETECPPPEAHSASCPEGFNVNDYSSTGRFTCVHDPGAAPSITVVCMAPTCADYEIVGNQIRCLPSDGPTPAE